jgi:hypothetical protein
MILFQSGINKGLTVMLDAHNDLLADGSVDSDFEGFVGFIGKRDSFPSTIDSGFQIRPGKENV